MSSLVLLGREPDAVRVPCRDDEDRRRQALGPGPGCSWLGRDDPERGTAGWNDVDDSGPIGVPILFGGHGRSPPSLPEGGSDRQVLDAPDEGGLGPLRLPGHFDGVDGSQQLGQDGA